LSIKPEYAEAIFRGEKRFEFRRILFRKAVDVVVVYVTSPVAIVVGEFDVEEIISDEVSGLWSRTNEYAGIDRKLFFEYFAGRELGHAIAIGDVRRYKRPLELGKAFGVRPPQSFLYLKDR
jgi:predicted transcriptional regulator